VYEGTGPGIRRALLRHRRRDGGGVFHDSNAGEPDQLETWAERGAEVTRRGTTTVDPQTPWKSMIVWFRAAFDLDPAVSIGFTDSDGTSQPPRPAAVAADPPGQSPHVVVSC
jgi:hypothetical protein